MQENVVNMVAISKTQEFTLVNVLQLYLTIPNTISYQQLENNNLLYKLYLLVLVNHSLMRVHQRNPLNSICYGISSFYLFIATISISSKSSLL